MTRDSSVTAEAVQPQWWTGHQAAPMIPLSLNKAIDDGSESTHSGSPSEPPMSPEPPKLSLAPGKLPDLSPACSTLGSKSTGASPMGLLLDCESLASPASPQCLGQGGLESLGSRQLKAAFDQIAQAPVESSSSCATPSALPPPPCYNAPLVFSAGLPPAPMLPPGVPEPPAAPPRLPANVPTSPRELWPTTAPPVATSPWQLGLATQAPLRDQPATLSSTVPSALLATPVCAPSGGLMLASTLQPPAHVGIGSTLGRLLLDPTLGTSASQPLLAADAVAASLGARGSGSLDGEVTMATHALAMLASGPFIPPLPPSSCYGSISISSAISESLGTAADAVAAAARDLGDKPVKVLLPWYPAHAALFDHTKPAKVPLGGY